MINKNYKSSKPKILVLLACYNGERYIEKQIESILKQTHSPYKINISIDKSNDQSVQIVEAYSKKYSQINITNTDKCFGSAATNFIHLLTSVDLKDVDFIALADQDDLWRSDKLKKAILKLKKDFDGYSSNVEAFWSTGRRKILLKNQPQKRFDHLFESAGPGHTFVISKKLVQSLQKFLIKNKFNKPNNYHDWLIYAYARTHGFKWYIDSYPGVEYRQHATNVAGANIGIKAFVSRANRVLSGEGFDFAFWLMKELKVHDPFIQSLAPVTRINLIRLAFKYNHCRRRLRDQVFFFFACILLAIIFPNRLRTI